MVCDTTGFGIKWISKCLRLKNGHMQNERGIFALLDCIVIG